MPSLISAPWGQATVRRCALQMKQPAHVGVGVPVYKWVQHIK